MTSTGVRSHGEMASAGQGDELVSAIKQMLVSFRPFIRKHGSADQAEDSLRRMEELDGDFHRCVAKSAAACKI